MQPFFFRLSVLVMITLFVFSSCSYSKKSAAKLLAEAKTKSYDIIVVPGVPFNTPEWDRVMRGRVFWSKYLYDLGIAKNIMYSGSSVYSPYYEGDIMALYAEALGIPKEHIFSETKAEHSTENIYYSYKKAKQLGFKTVALASDQFQTKSLSRFSRKKLSKDIGMIPWVMPIIRELDAKLTTPQIDHQKAFNPDFISIKKREGFWKRLRGTRGKNINPLFYE
jgi:uncharacterized SAM-binding protein YcdF (DUF218 family)